MLLFRLLTNIISMLFLAAIAYGVFFSSSLLVFGLAGWLIMNLAIIIGLVKFKRIALIPYVPFYLFVEPLATVFTLFAISALKFIGKKLRWRKLYQGYYHAGTKIIVK